MQSVHITTDVVGSNLDQGEVHNIMWKSLSVNYDRSFFFPGRPVSSTSKTDLHDITEQLLKLAFSSIKQISKNKDWYARNENNVSEWRHMSSRGLLFQWAITMNIQLSVLVYKVDIIIISSNITCSCHAMPEPFGHLVIHTNHSVTHSLLKEL